MEMNTIHPQGLDEHAAPEVMPPAKITIEHLDVYYGSFRAL